MNITTPIAETENFIVLDRYERLREEERAYQSEKQLEDSFIHDLVAQGYEFLKHVKDQEALLSNLKKEMERLNQLTFNASEWQRFLDEFLDKKNDGSKEKARKIHEDPRYDFHFDNGEFKNIHIIDHKQLSNNKLQVIQQFSQEGSYLNRYDVTILVNGLPLVQVELKRRGVALSEAFYQTNRYGKESYNAPGSLFKYLQIFVISNGTDSRYFANTTERSDKNKFDFTMHWARSDNSVIRDLKDFTATFFQKNTLLELLFHYSVLTANDILMVMRPYQIAATERILWKIKSSYHGKKWSCPEAGGYIWHTTGSGKTLTSFKAARLATELPFIEKVFFVVDRKDLDNQTMKEYEKFSPGSATSSASTAKLKENIGAQNRKIVVTTIQKLNILLKSEKSLPIYQKHVVFIFDECHRSQFGEAQRNLQKRFRYYYQFGFTGTPIFPENSLTGQTTAGVFGRELHSYVITDAIRDEKVLKFKVDYNDVRPKFRSLEQEIDEMKLSAHENKLALLHPERIQEISRYILDNFHQKTHRLSAGSDGFNAMFCVSSIEAAKAYYQCLKELQEGAKKPLVMATIYSFAPNEEQGALGDIQDEGFETQGMDLSSKEALQIAVNDYNRHFKSNFSLDSKGFENYFKDLSHRVKQKEVDLLIVVGMFLTGFDAPPLNTLFVDKNLRYHGLIQAYSRTNRIFGASKAFGNIVCFRDLEKATIDAITLFGEANSAQVILEKSFKEYILGFVDPLTEERQDGLFDVAEELLDRFPEPGLFSGESEKKAFVKVFGHYLRLENALQNFDQFQALKAFQELDCPDEKELKAFQIEHHLSDEDFQLIQTVPMPSPREVQDYLSAYSEVREWIQKERLDKNESQMALDWDEVVFEVDLLKSQEISLDYILELLAEAGKETKNKESLQEEAKRIIAASITNRKKEGLFMAFIEETDLSILTDVEQIQEAFYSFAEKEKQKEVLALIEDLGLNDEATRRYLARSLRRGYASENGTGLSDSLPRMGRLNPRYQTLRNELLEKARVLVEKYRGIGGEL